MALETEDDKDRLEDTFKELIASMETNKHGFNSYCSSEDLSIRLNQLTENHPMASTAFFNAIFPCRQKPEYQSS